MILVENNNNNDLKENNIIRVTNNNVKYYENLALQHSKESAKSATKSASYANDAKTYLNSCEQLKTTIDEETVQIVKLHSDNTENPHNVTASQVNAYSKSEMDSLLEEELAKKNQKLVAGENVLITDNEDGSQTIKSANTVSLNYLISENKPSINNVVLSGNKTSHDLGLASISDIPTKVSELNNDSGYLTTHQDITGKQDVLSAGVGISISENIISTVNRADTDLSNITDTGKKLIDGQWVAKEQVLSTATAIGTYTIDLSDYLPNDNYNYEVFLHDSLMQKSVTDSTHIDIVAGGVSINFARANSASVYATNSAVFPVDNTKKIKLVISTRKADSNSLTAYYYRRIGTNS